MVISANTNLSPENLAQILISIEEKLERKRSKKNEPRTCDIDIFDYNKMVIKKSKKLNLISPHPKMHIRSFVLLPLFDISKTWIHPIKKTTIKELVNSLKIKELRTVKLI